jgi:hypothetical protein
MRRTFGGTDQRRLNDYSMRKFGADVEVVSGVTV